MGFWHGNQLNLLDSEMVRFIAIDFYCNKFSIRAIIDLLPINNFFGFIVIAIAIRKKLLM